jgi:hypothetical protein
VTTLGVTVAGGPAGGVALLTAVLLVAVLLTALLLAVTVLLLAGPVARVMPARATPATPTTAAAMPVHRMACAATAALTALSQVIVVEVPDPAPCAELNSHRVINQDSYPQMITRRPAQVHKLRLP